MQLDIHRTSVAVTGADGVARVVVAGATTAHVHTVVVAVVVVGVAAEATGLKAMCTDAYRL